jgi:hypothetical protein
MRGIFGSKTKEEPFKHDFEKGDHVIRWTRIVVYPIQVHGIVFSVGEDIVTIIDFGLTANKSSQEKCDTPPVEGGDYPEEGSLQELIDDDDKRMVQVCQPHQTERISILTLTEPEDIKQWKKVNYGETIKNQRDWRWWRKEEGSEEVVGPSSSRSDSDKCIVEDDSKENASSGGQLSLERQVEMDTSPQLPSSDPANLVIARVRYLLNDPSIIPEHHILFSNSECIAVWCKTGRWSTLQASFFLHSTAAGNLKSTATLATVAGTSTVTSIVPATGISGWFGMTTTTTVSLFSAQPWLIPVLAGYGILTIGTPIIVLKKAKEQWASVTTKLTDGFWAWADADVYVEAIKYWSGL